MFGLFKRKQVIERNQIVVDYNPDTKRTLMIRTNGLTNQEVIYALKDAARCMGCKIRKRRKK